MELFKTVAFSLLLSVLCYKRHSLFYYEQSECLNFDYLRGYMPAKSHGCLRLTVPCANCLPGCVCPWTAPWSPDLANSNYLGRRTTWVWHLSMQWWPRQSGNTNLVWFPKCSPKRLSSSLVWLVAMKNTQGFLYKTKLSGMGTGRK